MIAAVLLLAVFWIEALAARGFRETLLWKDDRGFAFAMKE
jgi:hypothetical protein